MKRRPAASKFSATGSLARSVTCSELGIFDAATDEDAKWVQVATEGLYLGYGGGKKPFAFTKQHFDQAIANIHAHPSFVAGPNGEGSADVIPWDFDHASEMDPTSGALPAGGSPAQGWTRDLKIIAGADGKSQLWALTRFLEPARSYVKTKKYKWASVAAAFNAIDPVSAADTGMLITSIALTNQPFIQGMEQLAASARGGRIQEIQGHLDQTVQLGTDRYFDTARTAEEAVSYLKCLFDLPITSTLDVLMVELGKVQQWIAAGGAPLGVPLEDIVGGIRKILGLPALSAMPDVLDSVSEIVQRYVEEQAVASGQGLDANQSQAQATAATTRGQQMDLLKVRASKLGVRESEEAVTSAIDEHVELSEKLVKVFKCKNTPKALLDAATETVDHAKVAGDNLSALLKALGVADPAAGVAQVAKLMSQAEELEKAMPELKALRENTAAAAEAKASADVDAAMASHNLKGDGTRVALLMYRKSDPAKFAEHYPAKPAPAATQQQAALLTRQVVAGPGGIPLKLAAAQGAPVQTINDGTLPDLSLFPGSTPTERAMAYLRSTNLAFDKLTFDDQFKQGVALSRRCAGRAVA